MRFAAELGFEGGGDLLRLLGGLLGWVGRGAAGEGGGEQQGGGASGGGALYRRRGDFATRGGRLPEKSGIERSGSKRDAEWA
ncbi:hypothetical protein [Eikenella longinqua]|uniref:hypothetical protein n=1 Tax=Eikenella longinqua TaxID=1795827 RepID=UPI0012E8356F|nr:hypothetical protein [Eikenella longinqua]